MKNNKQIDHDGPNPNKMMGNLPKPSIWQYLRIRIGMRLYKWRILKGWDYDPINNKTHFHF